MNDLRVLLTVALPAPESVMGDDGRPTQGWSVRQDRLSPHAFRFDWIQATDSERHHGNAEERAALRADVVRAAKRTLDQCGYRARPEGTGLRISRVRMKQTESSS